MSQVTSISISQEIKAGERLPSFTENIRLPFQPDLIKVSNVYYEAKAGDRTVYKIRSNLAGGVDDVFVQLVDKIELAEPMLFTNKKTVSGSYTFNIDNLGLNEGIFMMTITFIKN